MGDMDYEHERAELERKFQKFARENPDHPAVIKAIACRIATPKDHDPSQCERDWLDLALKQPNHPRVLRVRKVLRHLNDGRAPVAEKTTFESYSASDGQPLDHVEPLRPKTTSTSNSERLYAKLSEKEMDDVCSDVVEHLRITKAFKLFGEKNSGNSTIN